MDTRKLPHLAILLVALVAPIVAAEDAPEYRIGPQDGLMIRISHPNEPPLALDVSPGGDIFFPQLGRMRVVGMTPAELEKSLRTLLLDGYYVDPKVAVSVTDPRSKKVLVLGEARNPGEVQVISSITLVELVTKVGGPAPGSNGKLTLIRPGKAGQRETMNLELAAIPAGEEDSALELRPGDIVNFNSAVKLGQFYIMGHVGRACVYPLTKGMTVQHAIILAGGMRRTGSERRTYITRKVDGKTVTTKAGMDDGVMDGDTIEVKEGWF